MSSKIFLSRRNLLILLSKLDREANGGKTSCSIIKYQNDRIEHQQSMKSIVVTAVNDEDYYNGFPAGIMHPSDEAIIAENLSQEQKMNFEDSTDFKM